MRAKSMHHLRNEVHTYTTIHSGSLARSFQQARYMALALPYMWRANDNHELWSSIIGEKQSRMNRKRRSPFFSRKAVVYICMASHASQLGD